MGERNAQNIGLVYLYAAFHLISSSNVLSYLFDFHNFREIFFIVSSIPVSCILLISCVIPPCIFQTDSNYCVDLLNTNQYNKTLSLSTNWVVTFLLQCRSLFVYVIMGVSFAL